MQTTSFWFVTLYSMYHITALIQRASFWVITRHLHVCGLFNVWSGLVGSGRVWSGLVGWWWGIWDKEKTRSLPKTLPLHTFYIPYRQWTSMQTLNEHCCLLWLFLKLKWLPTCIRTTCHALYRWQCSPNMRCSINGVEVGKGTNLCSLGFWSSSCATLFAKTENVQTPSYLMLRNIDFITTLVSLRYSHNSGSIFFPKSTSPILFKMCAQHGTSTIFVYPMSCLHLDAGGAIYDAESWTK